MSRGEGVVQACCSYDSRRWLLKQQQEHLAHVDVSDVVHACLSSAVETRPLLVKRRPHDGQLWFRRGSAVVQACFCCGLDVGRDI
eukprot:6444334-Pyramimonas_sp.AAC.2